MESKANREAILEAGDALPSVRNHRSSQIRRWTLSVVSKGEGDAVAAGMVEDILREGGFGCFNPDNPVHNYSCECSDKECKTGDPGKVCGKGKDNSERMAEGKWICFRDCFAHHLSEGGHFLQIIENGKPTKGQKWEFKCANKMGIIPEDFDAKVSLKTRARYMSEHKYPNYPQFVRIFVSASDHDDFESEMIKELRACKLSR